MLPWQHTIKRIIAFTDDCKHTKQTFASLLVYKSGLKIVSSKTSRDVGMGIYPYHVAACMGKTTSGKGIGTIRGIG